MPNKPRIPRERIVEAAFAMIRAEGWEALTARSLAARLGCSTQPLLYHFKSIEEIVDAAYGYADAFHTEYILRDDGTVDHAMLGIGLRYIRFAAEEPRLFRFLFQTNRFQGKSLEELTAAPESAFLLDQLGMEEKDAQSVFGILFAAVHGYASLLANNAMRYDAAEAERMLRCLGEALLPETGDRDDEAVQEE